MPWTGDEWEKVDRGINRFKRDVPRIAGTVATSWFKENFRKQGWVQGAVPWKPRDPSAARNEGRAILVDSGRLLRSIRAMDFKYMSVTVGSDVPYAGIHNEGGTINKKVWVRAHRRRTRRGGLAKVKRHRRQMNLKMPERRFIGESYMLNRELEAAFNRHLRKLLKR